MSKILSWLQQKPELHGFLRRLYGKTFGFWWFKMWYARHIGFWNGKKRLKLLSKKKSEKLMCELVSSNKPFMVCRYGTTEFRTLFSQDIDSLCRYSGFFPRDNKLLPRFKKEYIESSKMIDVLRIWNYKNNFFRKIRLLKNFPNIKHFLFPAVLGDERSPWVKQLFGKRVLVIHPFEKTIRKQYKKRKELGILPELESLEIIKAVQTIAGNRDDRFEDWFEALDYMKREIDSLKGKFDIALIGCGAYGLPLAAHVKSVGKQAIHVGGGLQLFFWD
jgi:hypothetical protein